MTTRGRSPGRSGLIKIPFCSLLPPLRLRPRRRRLRTRFSRRRRRASIWKTRTASSDLHSRTKQNRVVHRVDGCRVGLNSYCVCVFFTAFPIMSYDVTRDRKKFYETVGLRFTRTFGFFFLSNDSGIIRKYIKRSIRERPRANRADGVRFVLWSYDETVFYPNI